MLLFYALLFMLGNLKFLAIKVRVISHWFHLSFVQVHIFCTGYHPIFILNLFCSFKLSTRILPSYCFFFALSRCRNSLVLTPTRGCRAVIGLSLNINSVFFGLNFIGCLFSNSIICNVELLLAGHKLVIGFFFRSTRLYITHLTHFYLVLFLSWC